MGRKTEEIKVSASLSDHNDEQDEADEALWEEFCERLRDLAGERKYEQLSLLVF